ncbi:polyamine deacetylase HDAC10 isoform X2 [Chiloscyllium plagiosum]|uniref:polyamine deacetylase HDAC10 isoform X2 n=1 Tax=Chiloscyllium plagiosum TaxID=36176 RepID=UPI001CB7BCF5|nr:polyamine deacetylase HDAC10 isoform X2 [Chiloscyllium plagiosum]XP_043569684.1 polyamine deacetylase HDAC10 isoform X2 [Chiloscyllium plagiosum]
MALRTGLVYNEQMENYSLLWDFPVCSIEKPERLSASHEKLKYYGLLERCIPLSVREATEEELLLVHSLDYIEDVKSTVSMNVEELKTFSYNYNDVYFHPNSYHCAKVALGATLQLVDAVMLGKVRNGMALVRPPGHHSQKSKACGFCIFNNVAIAAKYAKEKYGAKRILIVDWDVHHGQGTQYTFEEDPSVLYFSWHRYENQQFWPNLKDSDYSAIGKGKGAGFNVNVPWNKTEMENVDYLAAFFYVLLPMAYEFNPELILVSAGFDTAIGDPEGEMCATPECFAHLTHLLMPLANGKLCIVLEGGYNLRSLSESVCMTVRALLGDPMPPLVGEIVPCISAIESVQNVRAVHQPYWKFLKYQDVLINETQPKKQNFGFDESDSESSTVTSTEEKKVPTGSDVNQDFEEFMDSHMKKVLISAPAIRTAFAGCVEKLTKLDQCLKVEERKITIEEAGILCSAGDYTHPMVEHLLLSLGKIFPLIDKIMQREARNGIVVSSTQLAGVSAARYALRVGANRIFLLLLGEANIPIDIQEDEKILVLQINGKQYEKKLSKYYIPVCWKEDNEWDGDLLYSLCEVILPLTYGYRPELVILVVGSNIGIQANTIAHVTHLLQVLAQGRILVISQVFVLWSLRLYIDNFFGVFHISYCKTAADHNNVETGHLAQHFHTDPLKSIPS